MSKTEKTLKEIYPIGSQIWHIISRTRGAWRIGEVIKQDNSEYGWDNGINVKQPGTNKKRFIYSYNGAWEVIPRSAIPHVPNGTVYLVDTNMGEMLSQRLENKTRFSVYECGTKAMTKGNLLGYLILPCFIYEANSFHTRPGYQTWLVNPNVYELLSFLGNKLPEITTVFKSLESYGKEATIAVSSI